MADPDTLFGVQLGTIRDRLATLSYFTGVHDIQAGSEAISGEAPFVPPAAFVSTAAETYGPNRYAAGGHGQRATTDVSVLFCVPAQRADSATADEVEQARKAILAILAGFTPDGADKPLDAVRYQVRLIADSLVWGEWIFRTGFNRNSG